MPKNNGVLFAYERVLNTKGTRPFLLKTFFLDSNILLNRKSAYFEETFCKKNGADSMLLLFQKKE